MRTELGARAKAIINADRAEARLEKAAQDVAVAKQADLFYPLCAAMRTYRVLRELYASERVVAAVRCARKGDTMALSEGPTFLAPWPADAVR